MKKTSVSVLLFSVFVAGCASNHKVPITKRDQMMLISKEDEVSISKNEYKKIISKAKICKDEVKIAQVRRVGNRITKNIKNHSNIKWQFILVENDSINACCLPDGRVIINTGVFKVAKNDDQLATVLSHEIAHAISRHGAARISRSKVLNAGEGIGAVIATIVNPFLLVPFIAAYETTTKHMITTPYSKIEENEADEIGIHLMKQANFDLNEAIVFWNNMEQINTKKRLSSSTHDAYDNRKNNIKRVIAKLTESS